MFTSYNFVTYLAFCQGLLVDELRNWIQEHGIAPIKSRKKEGKNYLYSYVLMADRFRVLDLITAILNAARTKQPILADIETLVSRLKSKIM